MNSYFKIASVRGIRDNILGEPVIYEDGYKVTDITKSHKEIMCDILEKVIKPKKMTSGTMHVMDYLGTKVVKESVSNFMLMSKGRYKSTRISTVDYEKKENKESGSGVSKDNSTSNG